MKQLTRKQLQNDLDAARKHRELAEEEYVREMKVRKEFEARERDARVSLAVIIGERDDWRAVFKTISKLVK